MIKNLIFDWGNVLIDVSMERFAKSCEDYGIRFTEDEVNSTHKAGFFLEYEKGNLSDGEFRDETFRMVNLGMKSGQGLL